MMSGPPARGPTARTEAWTMTTSPGATPSCRKSVASSAREYMTVIIAGAHTLRYEQKVCALSRVEPRLSVGGVQLGELCPHRRPRVLNGLRRTRALECGIDTPGRADQSLTCERGTFDVAGYAHNLLVERCIIGERGKCKPQLDVTFGIRAPGIETTRGRDAEVLALTAGQRLGTASQ